jgi:flagellar basal-body rod protein FlgC
VETGAFEISAAGMRAQRLRMDVIATNLAHVETTSVGLDGSRHVPYRRKAVLFTPGPRGPQAAVVEDPSPFRAEHDPDHPHAVREGEDAGTVYFPNVHPITETVEMMLAARAYEANLAAAETAKAMNAAALRILA